MYVPIIKDVQKNIAIRCENIYNDIKSWSDYKNTNKEERNYG